MVSGQTKKQYEKDTAAVTCGKRGSGGRRIKKWLWMAFGGMSLALGGIGILLPVLPTTPFVLLAAICFSRCSPRLYGLLCKSSWFGAYIENYRTKKGVPVAVKRRGIIALWLLLGLSCLLVQAAWVYGLLALVGVAVTTHLLLLKTKRE